MMTEEILKAALLGTDKYMPATIAAISGTQEKITAQQTSREDRFLKVAAAALLYEEAAALPQTVEVLLPECPPESLVQMNAKNASLLDMAVRKKEEVLLQYIVYRSNYRQQVAPPEMVPMLLNKATEQKGNQQAMLAMCGATGKWLCGINENWRMLVAEPAQDDNIWESGNHDARKLWLQQMREKDPQHALALLTETIDKESIAAKVSFVDVLRDKLSVGDEPLLQKLQEDKSQKVKDAATLLLRIMAGSALSRSYLSFITQVIQIKEERYLLISKKKVLHIKEQAEPPPTIYTTGIDKVSADKGVSDVLYLTGQLLSTTDLSALATALGVSDSELITLLLQHKHAHYLLPFLASAAVLHNNREWAIALLKQDGGTNIQLLRVLPVQERQQYYPQFVATSLPALLHFLFDAAYTTIPPDLASQIIDQLKKSPNNTTQAIYQRLALYMPAQVVGRIMTLKEEPGGDYNDRYFRAQLIEMMRMMELKNIIQ